MRATEAAAIASGQTSGLALMERAGAAVLEAVEAHWPGLATARPARPLRDDAAQAPPQAVVLCGPGNNGGDGFVIARLLRRRGWRVRVFLHGDPARLPADAAQNLARWRRIGPVAGLPAQPDFGRPDLIVDALFGLGLARPLEGFGPVFAAMRASGARLVAVDLPSGAEADASPAARDWPQAPADLIVTFHREKPAHAEARARGQAVIVAPIGLEGR